MCQLNTIFYLQATTIGSSIIYTEINNVLLQNIFKQRYMQCDLIHLNNIRQNTEAFIHSCKKRQCCFYIFIETDRYTTATKKLSNS